MNSKEIVLSLLESKRPDLSVAGLERELGISNGTIGKWDKAIPSTKMAQKVADYFHVPLTYIFGQDTDDMHSHKQDEMPIDLEETLSKLGPAVSFGGKELTDEQKLKFYEMAKLMFGD